jgi:hypothetical protein
MIPITSPPAASAASATIAHQPDGAAAIDQSQLTLGQCSPQGDSRFTISRVGASAGTAKYTNGR